MNSSYNWITYGLNEILSIKNFLLLYNADEDDDGDSRDEEHRRSWSGGEGVGVSQNSKLMLCCKMFSYFSRFPSPLESHFPPAPFSHLT